jgi:hypothetical protein
MIINGLECKVLLNRDLAELAGQAVLAELVIQRIGELSGLAALGLLATGDCSVPTLCTNW